jgi:hypothetical protein
VRSVHGRDDLGMALFVVRALGTRQTGDGDDAMRVIWLALALAVMGCGNTVREQATYSCRQAGYFGAVEDAGVWYCFRDRLGVPPVMPSKP